MAKKPYNGHESWNAWNVSLWVANDEGIYRLALDLKKRHGTKEAAKMLLADLPEKTPDGAPYSEHTLRLALRQL